MKQPYICIITGAASGIGKAIAHNLMREHNCVLVDLKDSEVKNIAKQHNAHFVEADLSDKEACKAVVEQTLERYGRVDVLINAAGFQIINPLEDFDVQDWQRMLDVMLTAPFLLSKYAWPSMQKHRFGRIVHINSIHGLVASPYKSAYVSAKHGLTGLTRVTAMEGGAYNITVNSICPAYVDTPLVRKQIHAQALQHGLSETDVIEKIMLEKSALKTLIDADDIAQFCAFLISDAAKSMSGGCYTMDGGWTSN
jgi:3-hydroxybutyrate dehydrogenase